jgi:hypothetical protein
VAIVQVRLDQQLRDELAKRAALQRRRPADEAAVIIERALRVDGAQHEKRATADV